MVSFDLQGNWDCHERQDFEVSGRNEIQATAFVFAPSALSGIISLHIVFFLCRIFCFGVEQRCARLRMGNGVVCRRLLQSGVKIS